MRRLLALFLTITLLTSFGVSAVAHAMEPAQVTNQSAQLFGHSPGDSDEVPADADKSMPHHHLSCHGHIVGVPCEDTSLVVMIVGRSSLRPGVAQRFAALAQSALRRPPRA